MLPPESETLTFLTPNFIMNNKHEEKPESSSWSNLNNENVRNLTFSCSVWLQCLIPRVVTCFISMCLQLKEIYSFFHLIFFLKFKKRNSRYPNLLILHNIFLLFQDLIRKFMHTLYSKPLTVFVMSGLLSIKLLRICSEYFTRIIFP